jgi:TolB-like protein/tetratricopeptide (TPR) repeat protein
MADVFLSYKREDSAKVRKLVAALRGRGLDVWWDEDIPASAPWEATIEKELGAARTVIVCWSPASVASENVRSEARVAREDGRLIQVFVKPCDPPLFFGERQGVDLAGWRGNGADARIDEIVEAVERTAPHRHGAPTAHHRRVAHFPLRFAAIAGALLLIAAVAAGWWFLGPEKAQGPTTIAVLPFRALNAADANLVDAIWDDTRGALGRNPNLRVIGRQAVEALADKHLDPSGYRRKLGADYLLDGSVQHIGDQVRMKLSLTRTRDETEVWSDQVGGKLDDVFAFQERVANEVEGLIRGRVAPGGGRRSENIATSGDVYGLYAEARAKDRRRDPGSARQAKTLLRKALSIDPNYAPAWAELGIATFFAREGDIPETKVRAEAVSHFKRALALAPNLAAAHAGLAMVQGYKPEAEAELRRAIALDPGNVEAWMWLGNLLGSQNRMKAALVAYSRATEIEPLWPQSVGNKVTALYYLGDTDGVARERARIEQAQDPVLLDKIDWRIAQISGHPGDMVRIMLQLRSKYPEEAAAVDNRIGQPLIQLGFVEEGLRARKLPLSLAGDFRGAPAPAPVLDRDYAPPLGLWQDMEAVAIYSRLLPNSGRLSEYVARYRRAFKSVDDFLAEFADHPMVLLAIAPTVATDLRAGGLDADADAILQATEPTVLRYFKNGPPEKDFLAQLAYYRAADGRDDEAVELLRKAVAGNWLPDRDGSAVDIAQEPCFARLVNRPDFQAVRGRILSRIEDERRKVPLALLARTYPPPAKVAA